ncbi:MAG: tetratricopeptide repeat protein [Verrucomicrobia bacterium]|nr:tetratricopeptide repeat protein [Verrucomicrobiota bacterium]
MPESVQSLVDEATFDFTMGDADAALAKLRSAVQQDPRAHPAWHALAEILFAEGRYPEALEAGNQAVALHEEDVHLHTTLSRICMELGDKETAEKHGARARVLGWKNQLHGEE